MYNPFYFNFIVIRRKNKFLENIISNKKDVNSKLISN